MLFWKLETKCESRTTASVNKHAEEVEPSLLHCKTVHPLRKIVWQFLERLNMELPHDLVILLLESAQEKLKYTPP